MAGRVAPTAIVRSGAQGCRSYCPRHPVRQCAPFGWDMIAPKRCARPPATRQRPWPDARTCGEEVSFEPPSRFTSLDHLVGAGEQRRRHFEAEYARGLGIDDQLELGRLLDR